MTCNALIFPVLQWGKDWVFIAHTHKSLMQIDQSWLLSLQKAVHDGEVHMLDSSGRMFDVVDVVPIPVRNPFKRLFGLALVDDVLANERHLKLKEFKAYVRKAVNARQRYDRGSYILEKTMDKLPRAATYREAIEALPKVY